MSNIGIAAQFFLQLALILSVSRIMGLAAKKLGQPQVIAEMVAGILLGGSVFGLILPGAHNALFPKASMSMIYVVAQMGIALSMFLVGLEFRLDLLRQNLRGVASISLTGILAPFTLGGVLALIICGNRTFFPENISAWQAVLFLGAAMSITAFPVLARIIRECGLMGTRLGTLVLAAGAVDDAAAWSMLAIVLATLSADASVAVLAISGTAVYVITTRLVSTRLLKRFPAMVDLKQGMNASAFSVVLILLMLVSFLADAIGVHAVFGAFVLGVAMPRGKFANELKRLIEPLTMNLLVPLFFVYSGLNTQIALVDTPLLMLVAMVVLLVACLGKGVGCWLAARLNGEGSKEAMAIGTLMNARGMMELIILNIGLERGIITPTLFTIMVMMAIATTLMATPVFKLIYKPQQKLEGSPTLETALNPMP